MTKVYLLAILFLLGGSFSFVCSISVINTGQMHQTGLSKERNSSKNRETVRSLLQARLSVSRSENENSASEQGANDCKDDKSKDCEQKGLCIWRSDDKDCQRLPTPYPTPPTKKPTQYPSSSPSKNPTQFPSVRPSAQPTTTTLNPTQSSYTANKFTGSLQSKIVYPYFFLVPSMDINITYMQTSMYNSNVGNSLADDYGDCYLGYCGDVSTSTSCTQIREIVDTGPYCTNKNLALVLEAGKTYGFYFGSNSDWTFINTRVATSGSAWGCTETGCQYYSRPYDNTYTMNGSGGLLQIQCGYGSSALLKYPFKLYPKSTDTPNNPDDENVNYGCVIPALKIKFEIV